MISPRISPSIRFPPPPPSVFFFFAAGQKLNSEKEGWEGTLLRGFYDQLTPSVSLLFCVFVCLIGKERVKGGGRLGWDQRKMRCKEGFLQMSTLPPEQKRETKGKRE